MAVRFHAGKEPVQRVALAAVLRVVPLVDGRAGPARNLRRGILTVVRDDEDAQALCGVTLGQQAPDETGKDGLLVSRADQHRVTVRRGRRVGRLRPKPPRKGDRHVDGVIKEEEKQQKAVVEVRLLDESDEPCVHSVTAFTFSHRSAVRTHISPDFGEYGLRSVCFGQIGKDGLKAVAIRPERL